MELIQIETDLHANQFRFARIAKQGVTTILLHAQKGASANLRYPPGLRHSVPCRTQRASTKIHTEDVLGKEFVKVSFAKSPICIQGGEDS